MVLCGAIQNGSLQSHQKTKVLTFCCHCFANGMNIHIMDFCACPKQNTWILYIMWLKVLLARQMSQKIAYQPRNHLECFLPSTVDERFAQKISEFQKWGGAAANHLPSSPYNYGHLWTCSCTKIQERMKHVKHVFLNSGGGGRIKRPSEKKWQRPFEADITEKTAEFTHVQNRKDFAKSKRLTTTQFGSFL